MDNFRIQVFSSSFNRAEHKLLTRSSREEMTMNQNNEKIFVTHCELLHPNQKESSSPIKFKLFHEKSNKLSRAAAAQLSYGRSLHSSCEIIFQLYLAFFTSSHTPNIKLVLFRGIFFWPILYKNCYFSSEETN